MKIYIGRPCGRVEVMMEDGNTYDLPPRNDLVNHSPDGFSWGYEGSGPAQLALAMLCDYFENDTLALQWYQRFKREVISTYKQDKSFLIYTDQIDTYFGVESETAIRN